MTIYQILQETGLPCVYAFHVDRKKPVEPPYIAYSGDGQDTFDADNTHYFRRNRFQIEFYFTQKNEETEAAIEDVLLDNGYLYDKSEDIYIEGENIFVIYYSI